MFTKRIRQAGFTLIELIVFIVIVSVGVVGLVSSMNYGIMRSADPLQTKQFAAIAEAVLSEVIHQPFTWCDPSDANSSTATSYAGCATASNAETAPTANETRDGSGSAGFFDNVIDYSGFKMDNISDPSGTTVFSGFRAEVSIAQVGSTIFSLADATAALAVTVTVCRVSGGTDCAGRDSYALTGYRFRYAPRY